MLSSFRVSIAAIAVSVFGLAVPAHAAGRGWWTQPGAVESNSARSVPAVTRQVDFEGSLDADRVTTFSIDVSEARATLQLRLPIDDAPVLFALRSHAVRTENFQLFEHGEGGLVAIAPPAPATYRSEAALPPGVDGGEPRAVVAAISFVGSPSASGVRAMILAEDGSAWYVQPAREIDAAAPADSHVLYPAEAVLPSDLRCGGALNGALVSDRNEAYGSFGNRAIGCLRRCEIAIDSDFEYFTLSGSSSAAVVSDVESLMNAVNLIYERDIRTTIVIPTHIVRATNVVYTNATTVFTRLETFAQEWSTNQAGVARDLAHLMTGVPSASMGGVAYIDALCDLLFGYVRSLHPRIKDASAWSRTRSGTTSGPSTATAIPTAPSCAPAATDAHATTRSSVRAASPSWSTE
jgi:hypothetical protein